MLEKFDRMPRISETPLAPFSFGRYDLRRRIGQGSSGVVYEAYDNNLGRVVAIKMSNITGASDPEEAQALLNEAQIGARTNHPNLTTVHDFGMDEKSSIPYMSMEYIRDSLQARLESGSPVPMDDVLKIISQVCAGVDALHKNEIIHRDLKPGNILIDLEGQIKICDFGFARPMRNLAIAQSYAAGTLQYMPFEQLNGDPIGNTVDTYAIGIILYQMLTGRVPFQGPRLLDYLSQHQSAPVPSFPESLHIPGPIASVISRSLEKDPDLRYSSAGQLAEDLVDF